MKLLLCLSFISVLLCATVEAQLLMPRMVCQMHDSVFESSGLVAVTPNRIYTHNDSGDQPRIFAVDTLGNLLRTVYLSPAAAVDYEDITRDPSGNMYIGDFGNNFNARTDLCIYKIADPELLSGDTAVSEIISFNYPDQQLFPPLPADQNFDCEAFFYYRDSLYLFSKNRGVSGYSRMYRLPTAAGNYTATLIDSFYTGKWITSACLNPSATAMVLLSESQLKLYTGIENGDFSTATGITLVMDSSQKEAITFINDTVVFISDEGFAGVGGHLYTVSLGEWIPRTAMEDEFAVQVLGNPSGEGFTLSLKGSSSYSIEIFDLSGKLIHKEIISDYDLPYHFSRKQAGILFVRIVSAESEVSTQTVVIY